MALSPAGVDVFYDVFLNNIIITEDLEQLSLPLGDLNPLTLYVVKVIAKNENGQSENTNEFTTIDIDEEGIPGNFELSIDLLLPNSALLKWTEAASEEGLPVLYSVYLNGNLLA